MASKRNHHRFRRSQARSVFGPVTLIHSRWTLAGCVLAIIAVTTWSYWPMLSGLFHSWMTDDDYSAGQLVPLVAMFFLWWDRKLLQQCVLAPCWRAGVLFLIAAQTAHIYGLLSFRFSAERYSFVLTLAALVLLMAGRQVLRRVSAILVFLFLMFPLPGRLHAAVSSPLQSLATSGSVFLLEAFGTRVTQQGNIVNLDNNIPLAVAEACSGLRMLTAFIIVAGFIAYMIKRPRWQKGVLLISSIPVAVICNIIRIFVTALIMLHLSRELGEKFFHDFAGLVMMPVATILMFGLLWLLQKLTEPESAPQRPEITVRSKPARSDSAAPVLKE